MFTRPVTVRVATAEVKVPEEVRTTHRYRLPSLPEPPGEVVTLERLEAMDWGLLSPRKSLNVSDPLRANSHRYDRAG